MMFYGMRRARACLCVVLAGLGGCGLSGGGAGVAPRDESLTFSPRVIEPGEPVPKGGGVFKVGSPYVIAGKTYVPRIDPAYDEVGVASWYGLLFHGRKTSNGEVYDMNALTAAHPTLPMPVYARVTNLDNGRSIIVRINDRGPYKHNRIIDLSQRAAELLDFKHRGTARVRVQYVGPAPLSGDDRYERSVLARQPWAASIVAAADRRPDAPSGQAPSAPPAFTRASLGPSPRPAGRSFYVLAGTFGDRANAERAMSRAAAAGHVEIVSRDGASGPLYQVSVGPFAAEEEARRAQGLLGAQFHGSAIVVR